MTKSKIRLSKINALPRPVHGKIRSDQRTEKTGLAREPKRRTSGKLPDPHFSGTTTYCVRSTRQRQIFNFLEHFPA